MFVIGLGLQILELTVANYDYLSTMQYTITSPVSMSANNFCFKKNHVTISYKYNNNNNNNNNNTI